MWRPFRHYITVRIERTRNMKKKKNLPVMLEIKTETHDPPHGSINSLLAFIVFVKR